MQCTLLAVVGGIEVADVAKAKAELDTIADVVCMHRCSPHTTHEL